MDFENEDAWILKMKIWIQKNGNLYFENENL